MKIITHICIITLPAVFTLLSAGCLSTTPATLQEAEIDLKGEKLPPGFYIHDRTVFEYNDMGQLVREAVTHDKGVADLETFVYEYNDKGIVTRVMVYNDKHNLDDYEIHEIDESGRVTREDEFRADGSLKNYKVYEYNDTERSVVKKFYDPKGVLYRYTVKKSDEAGNLIEESDYRK